MNLGIRLFLAVSGLVFCAALGSAYAQDTKGKFGLGYNYRYVAPDDDDFKTGGNNHSLDLTYGLTNNIALEAEIGHFMLKSKAGSKLGVYSFYPGVQLRMNPIKQFVPYLTAALGFQGYDYEKISGGDMKDKNFSLSYKTGGGVEYFLNKHLSLGLEVDYVYGNTGGEASLDVYGWQYGGGIKYYF